MESQQHVVVALDEMPEGHDFIAARISGQEVLIVRRGLEEFAAATWAATLRLSGPRVTTVVPAPRAGELSTAV